MRPLLSLGFLFGLILDLAPCRAQNPTDLPPGKKLISFEGFLSQVRWSQDGKTIVTCMFRKPKDDKEKLTFHFKTVELWDTITGKRIQSLGELEIPGFPRYYLSADGTRLVIIQNFGIVAREIEVWDVKKGNLDHRIPMERRVRPIECIAVSPKGERIADIYGLKGNYFEAAAKGNGGIDVYDAGSGKKIQTLKDEKSLPRTAIFTRDGESLVTRSTNDVVRLWNIKTGKVVREAQASLGSDNELALSPDGKKLLIPTEKHEALQLWSFPELRPLPTIPNPFHKVWRVQFSPSGKRLLVTGFREPRKDKEAKSGVMIWDMEKNKVLHDWNSHVDCGFSGENHIVVRERNGISLHPIGPFGKAADK
jgi:WD40 repeat protein